MEENSSDAMLAAKRSAGVTRGESQGMCVTHSPLPSANKVAHSDFKPQGRYHQKSKTGVSVAPQKRTGVLRKIFKQECIPVGCVPAAH